MHLPSKNLKRIDRLTGGPCFMVISLHIIMFYLLIWMGWLFAFTPPPPPPAYFELFALEDINDERTVWDDRAAHPVPSCEVMEGRGTGRCVGGKDKS